MRRLLATAALLAALCAVWLAPPLAVAEDAQQKQTVLVLAPYLRWDDLSASSMPITWSLAQDGAIGNVNSRSREHEEGEPGSPVEGALTLSSGVWALPPVAAVPAMSVDETIAGGSARDAYSRATGNDPGNAAIVYIGLPAAQRANAATGFKAQPGTLGQAVVDAGGSVYAIGNSDTGVSGTHEHVRPAAIVGMDRDGLVLFGDVSTRLLRPDPAFAFGVRTDVGRFRSTLESVPSDFEGLAVLDAGDMHRAVHFAPYSTPEVAQRMRAEALLTLDQVVGMARQRFPRATVVVMSMSTADGSSSGPEAFGPVIVASPEGTTADGLLTSDSTQRSSLLTSLDVAATAYVSATGDTRLAPGMVGSPAETLGGREPLEKRVSWLEAQSRAAVAVDSAKYPVANIFVALFVVALLASALVIASARKWKPATARGWARALKSVLGLIAAAPLAGWLMFALIRQPSDALWAYLSFGVSLLVVWGATMIAMRRFSSRLVLGGMALLTMLVICVDQWFGAPFSFTNFFGYSPIVAARFYGIGNEAASILLGAALVGVALLLDEWRGQTRATNLARIGVPAIGVSVVVTAAAPFWGANVGVAVWGVIGFGLAYLLMNEKRVTWKSVVLLGVAVVVTIAGFAVLDRLGGAQTHLARSLGSADQSGLSVLVDIVVRKAATNLRVLTATNWAYILVAVLGFLGFMRWRPQGEFADTLRDNPRFADAITVSLVAGAVAYFTEDSGIVIPALITFWIGIGLAWLMLDRVIDASGDGVR